MSALWPLAKPNDPKCSCVTGQYECWHCRRPKLEAIKRRMTAAELEYDRLAMAGWRKDEDDGPGCCSCHLSAPCGYCTTHCADCEQHEDDCTCHAEPTP